MSERQIKEEIEQIGYQEFYRYYQEKDTLIEQQKQEIERLNKESEQLRTALNSKESIIKEVREYIENEMPCLWEVDNAWEDINGNYQHNYKEYDTQILLNKLKGSDKE